MICFYYCWINLLLH